MLGVGFCVNPHDRAIEERCMARPPRYPDTGDETGVGPERGPTGGPPRWVAVVGIIIAIGLVALMIVLHLSGSIGPGAH
jgi:hypothetical protein